MKIIYEMAMGQSDAIERCCSLGKLFIKHFEKIYDNPDSEDRNHWISEMKGWLNDVKEIKLKSTKKILSKQNLDEWFFTSCANPSDFMNSPTSEKEEAYDNFYHCLHYDMSINEALNKINI